jgi:hypothetical protein
MLRCGIPSRVTPVSRVIFLPLSILCTNIVAIMFHTFWYEGDSVNTSQMDMKRKTCDIRTWKNHLFPDISSTYTDTLVPSLYQCVETRSIEVFSLFSQPLPHPVSISSSSAKHLPPTCEPFYATDTSHRKQETFLYEYPLHGVILPTENSQ